MSTKSLAILKKEATELGLTPYAALYGDRRQRETWEKLLKSAGDLAPLLPRPRCVQVPDRAQINWKLAIALLIGAIAVGVLLQPLSSKTFPIKITIIIQIGTK
jgi:hypothetical protein